MTNQLEELVREFYEYQLGCYVRTNVKFGRLERGGYEGEADILALDLKKKELTHIECTISELDDIEVREVANRKFRLSDNKYKEIISLPEDVMIKRKFIVRNTERVRQDLMPRNVEHQTTKQFLREIYNTIEWSLMDNAIPENYPILRGIQMIHWMKGRDDRIT